jgi:predicted AlkP superfamily phosphohydrolase/phosphomutase
MTDVIVLGLDGATWDVIDEPLEKGDLPELASLVGDGQSGTLESTYPPITAPAWLSMATGQNPGKTGVFYFLNRDSPDSFEFESLGSDSFRGQSFWDVLAARNRSVGVLNFPMLYPPYELGAGGFMVSGLGSPEDDTITKPDGLKAELDEVTGGYEVKVPYADPKYQQRPAELEADLHTMLEKREAAMSYLLTEKRPDVFFGVVSVTDWVQHYFWRHHDPSHALHDSEADEASRNAIENLWKRVDETVGMVAEFARKEDATMLIVSDHGFGPVNRTFHTNEWLESKGFRVPEKSSPVQSLRTNYFPYLRRIVEPVVSAIPQLNDLATSVGKSVRGSPGDAVDWERSIAFAPEQNLTCGMLYMLSDDAEDTTRVVEALENLTDDTGTPVDVDVSLPTERYHGPKTELAPDILFTVDDFECATDPRYTTAEGNLSEGPPSGARSGGHRTEGIYVAAGTGVDPGEGDEASLLDVAPTILYAMGEPIPEVMDGSPLMDVFTSEFRGHREVTRRPLSELVGPTGDDPARDTDAVQDRLEDLGYI